MKYSSLKKEKEKILHIPIASGGINLSQLPGNIGDRQLAEGKNIWFSEGKLKTRPGLRGGLDRLLSAKMTSFADDYKVKMTDTEVYHEGECKRIATEEVITSNSHCLCYVYLVGSSGKAASIGYLHFGRLDDSTFYCPENVTFFAGAPHNGGGIFALVKLYNREAPSQVYYAIYESSAHLGEWQPSYGYYIPTVYINGRGNKYEFAKMSGQVSAKSPTTLEALNMLNGNFYAYYTSDGYSNSFRLPFLRIDNSTVTCRIHYNLNSYIEWMVYGGETSKTEIFMGAKVTMNVDREKGTVYFTNESGNDCAIPLMSMYSENNIRIMARKEIAGGFDAVASSTLSKSSGSDIILSGGLETGRIYTAKYDNPLYFPLINDNVVGSANSAVTAIGTAQGKFYLFKATHVYKVEKVEGAEINKTALLPDNGTIFKETGSYKITNLSNKIGCKNGATIDFYENQPIWQADDGNVYILSSSSGKAELLSKEAEPYLKSELSGGETQAVLSGNKYLLSCGRKAAIMDYSNKTPVWYFWEFPPEVEIVGLTAFLEKFFLLCKGSETGVCYTAALQGERDIILEGSIGNETEVSKDIECALKTKSFALSNKGTKKRINRVILDLYASSKIKIGIGSRGAVSKFCLDEAHLLEGSENIVELIPNMYGEDSVYITLESDKGIATGEADIYYL